MTAFELDHHPPPPLDLRSDIANTGGTIGANEAGLTLLNNNIVKGGTFSDDGQVLGSFATIDATASTVTLTTNAEVGVRSSAPGNDRLLTLTGRFLNHGTILVEGNSAGALGAAEIFIGTSVGLSGGGKVTLINDAASSSNSGAFLGGAFNVDQNIYASNTLDNVDNLISGTGQLGNTSLLIINEAAGIISATSAGTLLLSTLSSNSEATLGGVVNKGVIRALGGTLDLAVGIDNRGGTIQALNDGAGHSGIVNLQGGTITGGTFASDPRDLGSFIQASDRQTTLDGTNGAVTLGAGSTLHIAPDSEVTVTGTIDNLGTVTIFSNTQSGVSPAIIAAGTAHLTGGGRVAMSFSGSPNDYIRGSGGTDLLDNVDNTIIGTGRIGFDEMSLTNEAAGIIAAQGGELDILTADSGDTFVNHGLLEALGGTLSIQGTIANTGGTIAARNDGTVDLASTTVQGGMLTGDTTDAASVFVTTSRTVLDGSANMVTIARSAQIQNGPGTLIVKGAITDQGTIALSASQSVAFFDQAILQMSGHVTLGGGGTVSLTDYSGLGGTHDQVVTGISSADTLDNTGVSIIGVGLLGNGAMTLINEAGGTITASGGELIVDTGSAAGINHGRMEAVAGGTLDIHSHIDNTGGTIGGGIVLLDNNGTVSGGTLNGVIAGNFGTLDGTSGTVTIAAGATAEVVPTLPNPFSKPLYLEGTITNQGVMLLRDDDSGLAVNSDLIVAGTVTLNGGGLVSLTGATAKDTGTANYITGSSISDTLDNVDNTITGFGKLGNGTMTLINASGGTVDAVDGTLLVYTAGTAITNKGRMTSGAGGVLDLRSTVANAGGTIGADGGTTDLDGIAVQGGTLDGAADGTIQVVSKATLDGTASGVVLAPGALLAVGSNTNLTLIGAVADHGVISNGGAIVNNAAFTLDGTLINNGVLSGGITLTGTGNLTNKVGRIVPGGVAATAAGETIENLGTIAGIVSLAGGDRVITGSGAVFSGGITGGSGGNTLEIATGPYALSNFNAAGTPRYSSLQIDAGVAVTTNTTDVLAGVTLINHGTLDLTAYTAQAPVQNDGSITGDVTLSGGVYAVTLAAGFPNRVIVSPGAGFAGIVDGGNPAGAAVVSTLELAGTPSTGTLAGIGTHFINLGAIAFDAGAQWTVEGNQTGLSGTIGGFSAGDAIEIDSIVADGSSYAGGILTLTGGGAHVATLDVPGQLSAANFQVTNVPGGVVVEIPCFLAGTLILTDQGEVAVEQLKAGDRVLTLSGESRPIVWIGVGRQPITRGQRCAATPVLVCRGALGDGIPHRDLRITKGHSLYLDHVLVPAEFLVNHRSIRWDDHAQTVEYYHIELSTHDILVANGAEAESYRDDGNRHLFENPANTWNGLPNPPYAPVLTGGARVDAMWRRLLDRAGHRPGVPLTVDADLHLPVNGRRVDARSRTDGRHIFDLPSNPREIRIASRSASPAELGLARDQRILGVALQEIRLWRGAKLRLLPASNPALVTGFNQFEPNEALRWTDGDAVLPGDFFEASGHGAELEIRTGGAIRYALEE